MTAIAPLTTREAWKALEAHYTKVRHLHLRTLFADDATRGERITVEAVGIYFDYSKHRITDETRTLLFQLAEESGLRARIDTMVRGDKINVTEKWAVRHDTGDRTPRCANFVLKYSRKDQNRSNRLDQIEAS
jgi:glucose-6-phosphate isomerase